MRVLVTGSRTWEDRRAIYKALVELQQNHCEPGYDGQGHFVDWLTNGWVIVHGACPTGADAFADDFATVNWITTERHPAQWRRDDGTIDKGAGFRRNEHMVNLGADICLAFLMLCVERKCQGGPLHYTHGASHTADLAERAGIPTERFYG